ncbi:permease for cytosine/purines, uracil, thiamine, allantoin-domain-containing protein [Dipodascopsis uninucleata]
MGASGENNGSAEFDTAKKNSSTLNTAVTSAESIEPYHPKNEESNYVNVSSFVGNGIEDHVDYDFDANEGKKSFWRKVDDFLKLESHSGERNSNSDLDPVPPERRTWTTFNYITYWISDNFTPTAFRRASSLIAIGMSWRMALVNVAIGEIIVALAVTINGYIGAKYRIPFSVQARASFGWYFAYFMIFQRMVVSIFWYGTSVYTGGECVRSMIYAIWPSFRNLKNHLPASSHTNTQFMISYFIYFILTVPLHYISVDRIRFLFTIKAIILPIIGFGILGWTVKNTSLGENDLWNQGPTVSGTALHWVFVQGLYANIGAWSTLAINSPDFTRYTTRTRNIYSMALALPVTACLVALFGIICAVGSKLLWGEVLWDPLLFIDNWTSKGGRAAAFFCALGMFIAQACSNISANSISSANDLTCLLPRYVNIRRGQFIVSILGAWAFTPWNIMTSATAFLSFMSGYTVWLGPIGGILMCDFFFVHKRKYDVWELYKYDGIYRYNKLGTNWRSAIAFVIGFAPLLPGFITQVNNKIVVDKAWLRLYYCGYFYGVGSSMLVYYVLSVLFPARETMIEHAVYCDDEILFVHDIEQTEYDSYGEKRSE